ncbi:hypothetical protein ACE1TI_15415 [Alteribacillus sp. JSM 102045]|uniref:hypothetical protein n=1 Tax=Alteribacillus sp. JSM 102045 TaxID=1562101 RepID=UPI0035C1B128
MTGEHLPVEADQGDCAFVRFLFSAGGAITLNQKVGSGDRSAPSLSIICRNITKKQVTGTSTSFQDPCLITLFPRFLQLWSSRLFLGNCFNFQSPASGFKILALAKESQEVLITRMLRKKKMGLSLTFETTLFLWCKENFSETFI